MEDSLVFVTKDNQKVTTTREVGECCGTIKNLLEDVSEKDMKEGVPLPEVDSNTLTRVLEYAKHYLGTPGEEENRDDDWNKQFFKLPNEDLFNLILASNYLDYKNLLDNTCKVVADMIKGKTPEQIRQTFGIENDFTPEEEAEIAKENEWAEEK